MNDIFKIIEEVNLESIKFESFCNIVEVEESTPFESIANEGLIDFIKGDPNKVKTADMKNGLKDGVKIKYTKGQKLKDKAVFKKVELAYGVELPANLKKFIELYNGCTIEGKNTWEMKNFNEGSTSYILDKEEVDFFKNTVKINFIPLLNDGFGNYYGVSENGKIGFFNHDSGNVEDLADTWSNFLTTKNL